MGKSLKVESLALDISFIENAIFYYTLFIFVVDAKKESKKS